jgi:hypothetical protein
MNIKEYKQAVIERQRIITLNRQRNIARLQGKSNLPNLEVPVLPSKPKVKIAYDKQGNYLGRILENMEIQSEWVIKEEDDIRA